MTGFTRKYYSQLNRQNRYPLPITPALRGSPLDKDPQPRHTEPKHTGWAKHCQLCQEWEAYVHKVTSPVIDYYLDGHGAKQGAELL